MARNFPIAVLRYNWRGEGPHPAGWQDAIFEKLFTSPLWPWSLPKFWSDGSLGVLDLASGARVFPWRELHLDHALVPDPKKPGKMMCNHSRAEVFKAGLKDADPDFDIEKFGVVIVFVDSPPSPAGGLTSENGAVLDWNATQSYYAHEVGHALLLTHSGDSRGNDYGDPYCIMSAETATLMFNLMRALPDPDLPLKFWSNVGCLPAAATSRFWLEGTPSIVQFPADARDQPHSVTLHAFTTASLGDPVLATIDVDGDKWTAEYRVPKGWDAALPSRGWDAALPSKALVMHKINQPPQPKQEATTWFMGALQIPFDRGMNSWQDPLGADIGVVVSYFDDEKITFHFRRSRQHKIELQEKRERLRTVRGPRLREKFPIWNGLCGEALFDFYREANSERIKIQAIPTAYGNPAFTWKVNGKTVTPGSPVSFATTQYTDNGSSITKKDVTVTVATRTNDDSNKPLPGNELWLQNDPANGTFELEIEVDVDEQPSSPPATTASVWDQFEGDVLVIEGKDEADRKCRDYWESIGTKLPKRELNKMIDKGDPIWKIVHEVAHRHDEEEELVQLVRVARALRGSDPEHSHELAEALARRLRVPEEVITHLPG
jgi:hypothetical protein